MFVLKSTHKAALKMLKDEHETALLREREYHEALTAQLKLQMEDLRRLVFMPKPTYQETLPIRVANAVIDGSEVLPQEDEEKENELRFANSLVDGTYDNSEGMWEN